MDYKLTRSLNGQETDDVVILLDGSSPVKFIPKDPKNSDWIKYQDWLNHGNTPQSAD